MRALHKGLRPSVVRALDAAAIPASKVGSRRHERLTDAERDLYLWILRCFAATGRPSATESRTVGESFGLDTDEAFMRLAHEDLVHIGTDGEIVVAYPFSGRPTDHVVRFVGGHEVYAMCAIDALGMASMFDASIEIFSRDPLTREVISIELTSAGPGAWDPVETVVLCGASGEGDSCCSCCPVLNFFASAENCQRWLDTRRDVGGYVMSQLEAVEAGRTVFGDVLLAPRRDPELPSSV